jgi:hypothetical protein
VRKVPAHARERGHRHDLRDRGQEPGLDAVRHESVDETVRPAQFIRMHLPVLPYIGTHCLAPVRLE